MKLLSIIHGPVFGGAHIQLMRLRRPLEKLGWETIALAPDDADLTVERMREDGVETVTMGLHRMRATPDPRVQFPFLAALPREVRQIAKLIDDRGIDVVQVHGPTNPHGAIAARRSGAAVTWQIYDTVAPMWLRRASMPMVTRLADVITTWGEGLGHEHPGTASLGERWIPVFPPVDASRFAFSPEDRERARAELNIPDGAIVIGTVGNRNPTKGHDELVQATAIVRERHSSVVTRILGAPSPVHAQYEANLHAEIARLGFAGNGIVEVVDPGMRVPELEPAFDIYAMTSVPRSEGVPTAILEAMASGLPVVATRVGAIAELVRDGVTGFVVEPNRPDLAAAAIEKLVADPELRRRFGAAARELAVGQYDLDVLAKRHARAHELALEHSRARRG